MLSNRTLGLMAGIIVTLIGITLWLSWNFGYWSDDGPRVDHTSLFLPSAICGTLGIIAAAIIMIATIYGPKSVYGNPGFVKHLANECAGWGAVVLILPSFMGALMAGTDIPNNVSNGSVPFHWATFGSYSGSLLAGLLVTNLLLSLVLYFWADRPGDLTIDSWLSRVVQA
ncbi:MAG TPA: hypothetical protein VK694_06885 [Verrucomicrobiae bacterium]|nr:hypothetical protein [Verrucomicrobiae bacterium]